jgi:hypothetical protein
MSACGKDQTSSDSAPVDSGPVKLVVEGYKNFNIIEHNGKYYAVHQNEGVFEMVKVARKEYKKIFIADSVQAVENLIDESLLTPKLVAENYKGFNIISFGAQFYGLSQDAGAFDIGKVHRNEYRQIFAGDSEAKVKKEIDQSLKSH